MSFTLDLANGTPLTIHIDPHDFEAALKIARAHGKYSEKDRVRTYKSYWKVQLVYTYDYYDEGLVDAVLAEVHDASLIRALTRIEEHANEIGEVVEEVVYQAKREDDEELYKKLEQESHIALVTYSREAAEQRRKQRQEEEVALKTKLLSKRYCSICNTLQFNTPSGWTCCNGHGGVPGVDKDGNVVYDEDGR